MCEKTCVEMSHSWCEIINKYMSRRPRNQTNTFCKKGQKQPFKSDNLSANKSSYFININWKCCVDFSKNWSSQHSILNSSGWTLLVPLQGNAADHNIPLLQRRDRLSFYELKYKRNNILYKKEPCFFYHILI